jgi:hypothetical protein
LECVARLCSKSVRHLDGRDLPALDALGPLVAPSLRLGRHSPGPLGHLKPVDPSVSVSNYYLVHSCALAGVLCEAILILCSVPITSIGWLSSIMCSNSCIATVNFRLLVKEDQWYMHKHSLTDSLSLGINSSLTINLRNSLYRVHCLNDNFTNSKPQTAVTSTDGQPCRIGEYSALAA